MPNLPSLTISTLNHSKLQRCPDRKSDRAGYGVKRERCFPRRLKTVLPESERGDIPRADSVALTLKNFSAGFRGAVTGALIGFWALIVPVVAESGESDGCGV